MNKIVPVDLGGSLQRCAIAPPLRKPWDVESVRALIGKTTERFPDHGIEVGFYHGAFPSDEMLSEVAGRRLRLSCHPGDLDRTRAAAFLDAGGCVVELEAMSFDPHVLRTCERNYTVARVKNMAKALKEVGFQVGVHLVPGLPGQDVESMLADANCLSHDGKPWVDFVRLWPALGFAGSKLAVWAEEGRWEPLDLGTSVNILAEMVDCIEAQGVSVARIGVQPGQDIPVKAVAGPVHPNIRGQVESQRFAGRLDSLLDSVPEGARVVVVVNPKDLHLAKGVSNINTRSMTHRHQLASMDFQTDTDVGRGTVTVARIE